MIGKMKDPRIWVSGILLGVALIKFLTDTGESPGGLVKQGSEIDILDLSKRDKVELISKYLDRNV